MGRRILVVGVVCAVLTCTPWPMRAGQPPDPDALQRAVGQVLQTAPSATIRDQLSALRALYLPGAPPTRWIDASGIPTTSGRQALRLLQSASDDGLDPLDYPVLHADLATSGARGTALPSAATVAELDVSLTAALLRFAHDLHYGRVDPDALGFELGPRASDLDLPALLEQARAQGSFDRMVAALRPPYPQYEALRAQLARYRTLKEVSLDPLALPAPIKRGNPVPDATAKAVAAYLVRIGYLEPRATFPEMPIDMAWLEEGIRRFQQRQGLAVDGVIGTSTRAALLVPQSWRLRQIELALERLRWIPPLDTPRAIAIDIPMFRVWAWDRTRGSALSTGVIVGRAVRTQTPVLTGVLREIIFRPYWNIPRSILIGEVLPQAARDPAYLERQQMEIVAGESDNAPVVAATADNLARLRAGQLRLRQRPGPHNSLGLIKFMFPNDKSVYMHGTPAQSLFAQARRDFSHGCVRVEDPVALAEWVLASQPSWDRDAIVRATRGRDNYHVAVTDPVRVILFYTTAVVMPEDGTLRFAEDIYRHDVALDRALAAR